MENFEDIVSGLDLSTVDDDPTCPTDYFDDESWFDDAGFAEEFELLEKEVKEDLHHSDEAYMFPRPIPEGLYRTRRSGTD